MDPVRRERTATRRLLTRALFVLGGAAAAWAVSASTASADSGTALVRDLGSAIESVPLPGTAVLTEGEAAAGDIVDGALHVLRTPVEPVIEDHANAAIATVTGHLGQATPPQRVDNPLPTLPDLSPRPESDAVDGPHAVVSESGWPVAVSAAEAQRHGESAPSVLSPTDVESFTTRGPPETSSQTPSGPSPLAPLSLPAPAQSGHSGPGTSGDAPQSGLLSTVAEVAETAVVRAPSAARADVPAAVDAQPGVTPD